MKVGPNRLRAPSPSLLEAASARVAATGRSDRRRLGMAAETGMAAEKGLTRGPLGNPGGNMGVKVCQTTLKFKTAVTPTSR